jgi:hypothetical protein
VKGRKPARTLNKKRGSLKMTEKIFSCFSLEAGVLLCIAFASLASQNGWKKWNDWVIKNFAQPSQRR